MELTSCSWQSLLLFITLSLCLAASLIFLLNSPRRRSKSLPPGPPALLFLAKFLALRQSIFDLPQILRELHARHGPVISVRLFRPLVFVSDRHLAHRVLVQSGVTFADRPQVFEPGHLFTSGARNINAAPYGPYWRLVRPTSPPRCCTRPVSACSRRRGGGHATRSSTTSSQPAAAARGPSP
ncbi:hypothetical protein QYE76_003981 [Lolium multiflorum]|uniref:Cytochrome P450 n=1 Tax=Lolium multiflorum TaxID=4521 RepID=A0AAD8RTK6_LOLMU|nr:hypothetical protein QYE76_003981 [Lolium multiflorum]